MEGQGAGEQAMEVDFSSRTDQPQPIKNKQKPRNSGKPVVSSATLKAACAELIQSLIDEEFFKLGVEIGKSSKWGQLDNLGVLNRGPDETASKRERGKAEVECPVCYSVVMASKYTPHLENCMGRGRSSSRVASMNEGPVSSSRSAGKGQSSSSQAQNPVKPKQKKDSGSGKGETLVQTDNDEDEAYKQKKSKKVAPKPKARRSQSSQKKRRNSEGAGSHGQSASFAHSAPLCVTESSESLSVNDKFSRMSQA